MNQNSWRFENKRRVLSQRHRGTKRGIQGSWVAFPSCCVFFARFVAIFWKLVRKTRNGRINVSPSSPINPLGIRNWFWTSPWTSVRSVREIDFQAVDWGRQSFSQICSILRKWEKSSAKNAALSVLNQSFYPFLMFFLKLALPLLIDIRKREHVGAKAPE